MKSAFVGYRYLFNTLTFLHSPFCVRGAQAARLYLIFGLEAEAEGEAITVGRVGVVGDAVGVDKTKGRGAARIWRALPPVVGRTIVSQLFNSVG